MSWQVMLGRVYDGRMVDVWSTGCSLFVMLAGAFPFLQVGPRAQLVHNRNSQPRVAPWEADPEAV